MKTLKVVFALTVLLLLAGCQNESFNPVDQGNTIDKPVVIKVYLVPFGKNEPSASGLINYTENPKNLTFRGSNLRPNTNYVIMCGTEIICNGTSNGGGNLYISGAYKFIYNAPFSLWYGDGLNGVVRVPEEVAKVLYESVVRWSTK